MADGLKVELVTRDFNRMLAELAAIDPKIEFRDIIIAEATAVVEGALRRSAAAKVQRIKDRQASRTWTTFAGKKYHIAEWRLPDHLWNQIQRQRKERLQTRLNARGLSKQSWLHVASALGKTISVPAYVTNANYKGQQYPIDGESSEEGVSKNYALTIINSSPIVQKAGGQFALLSAMRGRASYFRRNLAHGVFDSIATRAKKYPGIFTSPVPAALS
jgi:hypothetical protein